LQDKAIDYKYVNSILTNFIPYGFSVTVLCNGGNPIRDLSATSTPYW
jgi:hypothetical protein